MNTNKEELPSSQESKSSEVESAKKRTLSQNEEIAPHPKDALSKSIRDRGEAHFFSSLCFEPRGVSFETQEDDEDIILLIRRSFYTNVPWLFASFLLALIPIPVALFQLLSFLQLETSTQIFYLIFYYLLVLGFVLLNFTLWFFHVALITTKRIIDFDLHGLLVRDVAETRITLVQDVSYKQVGFLRSLFNFGHILVQTAGSQQNIEFDRAPQPAVIARIIGDMLGVEAHEE